MAHKKSFEELDRTLQDLRGNSELTGFTLVILSEDFLQTLPVIPKTTPVDEISSCLKQSFLWPRVKKAQLRTNMRDKHSNDEETRHFAENSYKFVKALSQLIV